MNNLCLRGEIFRSTDDPHSTNACCEHLPDGLLVVEKGYVVYCGVADTSDPRAMHARRFRGLLTPGFIDAHVHYPQLGVLAAPATHLLDWLTHHTFPHEARFADIALAQQQAELFIDLLLSCGTTSALVFATSHAHAADALFAAAQRRNLRLITGKVLSDRNVPDALRDSVRTARDESSALIERWHGTGRLGYAVTPRFALTSTSEQLAVAGELLAAHPGVLLHTHLSESPTEIAAVARLFPTACDYVDVYAQHGLVTDRSVFAHSIHLTTREWQTLATAQASVAHCPCSNLFLGSGLFRADHARKHGVTVALGSDIGGGNALSLLRVMDEAYKVARLNDIPMDALWLWYAATLGAARALGIDAHVGDLAPGKEADFVILDAHEHAILAQRLASCSDWRERLFAYALLGDERCVSEVYVLGKRVNG